MAAYGRFWRFYPAALAVYRPDVGAGAAAVAARAVGVGASAHGPGPHLGCAPMPVAKREKARSCCRCPLALPLPSPTRVAHRSGCSSLLLIGMGGSEDKDSMAPHMIDRPL